LSITACESPSTEGIHDPPSGQPDLALSPDLSPPPDLLPPRPPRTSVLTQHNDRSRTGANLAEKSLTPAAVQARFAKLRTIPVDDETYAQPLILPDVAVAGAGVHDVLFVATVNNSVYAFDADDGTQLWKVNLGQASGGVPVTNNDVGQTCGQYRDFSGNI